MVLDTRYCGESFCCRTGDKLSYRDLEYFQISYLAASGQIEFNLIVSDQAKAFSLSVIYFSNSVLILVEPNPTTKIKPEV